ncbi:peptide chain release factor N(5)-glutamine methyltransferase [candidate division KSB1 bacterium]|nr:peptide chain release factor N(5)-glutamine methyltransferase [candidate division KSB1 bacterium]
MIDSPKQWSVASLIGSTSEYLLEKGFENSRLEAERLLAHVLGLQRIDLYLQFDRPLKHDELSHFKILLRKRLEQVPLQYLIGETEFMSLSFLVTPDVLIPRPETELLVEKAIEFCEQEWQNSPTIHALDIGTGSGAIAVALAYHEPRLHIVAVDRSDTALEIAQKNGIRHGVSNRIEFLHHDAADIWPKSWTNSFDLILSNPPYIREDEFALLPDEIRRYEPRSALLAQMEGLEFYLLFSKLLPQLMRPQGIALLEIGADMAADAVACFVGCGFERVEVLKDLAGRDRVLQLRKV